MKLDPELIRTILKRVEDAPTGQGVGVADFPEEMRNLELVAHVELLDEEKLLIGNVLTGSQGVPVDFHITRLTMKGHEFIASARNDSVWQKTMTVVKDNGGSIAFDLLVSLVKAKAKELLGI